MLTTVACTIRKWDSSVVEHRGRSREDQGSNQVITGSHCVSELLIYILAEKASLTTRWIIEIDSHVVLHAKP